MGEQRQEQQLSKPAHPTAGWIVVAPFPRPDEPAKESEGAVIAIGGAMMVDLRKLSSLGAVSDGIRGGVLMEAGPTAEATERDVLMPFTPGATIFYHEQSAILIGGFHYLAASSVLAWDEAPA